VASDCPYGPAVQVPTAQYPCPGSCGCWTADGNVPCLACWFRANPVSPAQQRRLPVEHRLPDGHPRVRSIPRR
jgi:hypothetical protein